MERANKEVNRHIRNILSDKECVANWPQMLCMTEKLLNSSVKQPLGASPNALLFGNATVQEPGMMAEMDQTEYEVGDYVTGDKNWTTQENTDLGCAAHTW